MKLVYDLCCMQDVKKTAQVTVAQLSVELKSI